MLQRHLSHTDGLTCENAVPGESRSGLSALT
jgi:hypothetical protein